MISYNDHAALCREAAADMTEIGANREAKALTALAKKYEDKVKDKGPRKQKKEAQG